MINIRPGILFWSGKALSHGSIFLGSKIVCKLAISTLQKASKLDLRELEGLKTKSPPATF